MKRDSSERSAAIAPSLGLIVGFSVLLLVTVDASDPVNWNDPGWWTSYGAMNTNTANNSAVANQGELKQFTSAAVKELNADLSNAGGAGLPLSNLVYGWQQDYATNGYATNTAAPYYGHKPSDYQAVNVGQLKYIASLVYSQLYDAGYMDLYPFWITQNHSTDTNAATLGQLKEVFNYDLSLSGASNLVSTLNTNGVVNLSWTFPSTNSGTSYVLEQANQDGTWDVLSTFTNTATTSYSVTNLASEENPSFQIIAENGVRQSLPAATPIDTGMIAPTQVADYPGQQPGEIDLFWHNNATDATYIQIHESLDGINWNIIATLNNPAANYYAVTNLTIGQSYYFGVSAGNN